MQKPTDVQKMLLDIKEEERKLKRKASKKRRRTKAQLEERRIQVAKLMMKGMSVPDMQAALGATESEIRNDVKVIKEQNIIIANGIEIPEFVGESLRVFNRVEQEAFAQYEEAAIDKKGQFLNIALGARKDQAAFLEKVGVIRNQPIEQQVTIQHQIVQLTAEKEAEVRAVLLSNHLQKKLPEPTPPVEEADVIDV